MSIEPSEIRVTSTPNELASMSASRLVEGYASGSWTPSEVIEAVIDEIEHVDSRLNMVAAPLFEEARADAEKATADWKAGRPAGPLSGVPITVKDLIYVGGAPYGAGAPGLATFIAPRDAAVVERVRRAGAILTCKTTTCESGYKLTADSPVDGVTRNPWNPAYTSGGSSGGAAVGVATGCGPLALGTDAVGSIRVPSAFCGVIGIKPTFGLVPRSPGFSPPAWASLAHTGPIARSVADAALLLSVIAGYDVRDAGSLPTSGHAYSAKAQSLKGLAVAASVDFGYAPVDPEVRRAFGEAVDVLRRLGAEIGEDAIKLPSDVLEATLKPIAYSEQAAAVAARDSGDFAQSEERYREVIREGREFSAVEYIVAGYRRGDLRASFVELFKSSAVLITPTVAVPAFEAGAIGVDTIDGRKVDPHLGWSPFSWPINLTGLPAATIPCGFSRDGLPIGLQIIAPWLEEQRILTVAAALEEAIGPFPIARA
jgi:aspartyl-tRNA(Asn)/glutamyl-tRNA(Gln) amidotransferase subunit A